ncbi:MAG: [FeFe] hydrogenase H-cluster maturation GTPase HydF [Ruminococcaceae bacterium]|nr:[FeFe] hydrogenase H-cluster maturation GTPase HydF [Oscillospiraceae bacterium]
MAGLNETPNANRIHIGFFGKRNSGKSSLINLFTGHEVSIVADYAGTTTDPVYKAMEINPIGPCTIIDTAGFDDEGELGLKRVEKTAMAAQKTDIAILVFAAGDLNIDTELEWYDKFKERKTPCVIVINKADCDMPGALALRTLIQDKTGLQGLIVSTRTGLNIDKIKDMVIRSLPENYGNDSITGKLVETGDVVMLVMPQDIQAPRGRLILPQVQTIRDLLDKKATVICTVTDRLSESLAALTKPPKLIITDSQVFKYVYENKPESSMLTSFSVLFAAYKGDIQYYVEGAKAIDALTDKSRVLIAECCTHAPLTEDIGRVKIPNMLKKRFGEGLIVDMVSGTDFPEDLSSYDLVIQCGGCMFNRKYIMSRIDAARKQKVPMTNYGVAIAHLTGILNKVTTT